MDFKVNNVELETDEKLFIIVKDKIKKEPIFKGFLNEADGIYSTKIKLPYYCDSVDIYVYKQNKSEKDFTVKSENFLGKTKEYISYILD